MLLSVILILLYSFIYFLNHCQKCAQNTKQEEWNFSTLISNATRMIFLWRGYASNWQSAKVRAIVLILISPSVITQRHDRITLAVICKTYRLSGLWTQMQFYLSFLLCKSGRNYCTHGFTLAVGAATFSQFFHKSKQILIVWEHHRKSVSSCNLLVNTAIRWNW